MKNIKKAANTNPDISPEEGLRNELRDTQILQRISNYIIDEENIESFYELLLAAAMELMSSDFASIQILQPDKDALYLLAYRNFHPESAKQWEYVQAGPPTSWGQALKQGRRFIIDDVEQPPFPLDKADYDAYRLSGIVAMQSTPLISRSGKQVGMMSTHWRKVHQPAERELSMFEIVTRQVADLFERNSSLAMLRESEEKYTALFSASPVPFMVLDPTPPDFWITDANEAYFKATLTTPETLIGRRLFDVFTDDPTREGQLGSEALDISLQKVLATKKPDHMLPTRYDMITPEGTFQEHWWLAINAPLLDSSGNITAILHQVTRITELHFAELAAQENQERQDFLLKLSDALKEIAEPAEIQRIATRLLGEQIGASRVFYVVVNEDGDTADISAIIRMVFRTGLAAIRFRLSRLMPLTNGVPDGRRVLAM